MASNEISEDAVPRYEDGARSVTPDEKSTSDDKKSFSDKDDLEVTPVPALYDAEKASIRGDEIDERFDMSSGEQFDESSFPFEETHQLTVRAVVVGTGLGCVVAASNIYLGLQTGFTFAASLFGAILGYAILKSVGQILPEKFGGGPFGPKENCTVQTAATAAGSLTGMFVAAVPAMYQLNLLSVNPVDDFGRLLSFCAVSAYYGVFFAIPLRSFYILKQKLIFPTPTATAYTIRSLHTPGGEATAKKQARALLYAFLAAFTFVVVNQYAAGILKDWHIFYWLYQWGWRKALVVDNWGWYLELTPAFFGAGMLSGMNASYYFFTGSFLMWAMIGPSIIATGQAMGKQSKIEPLRWNYLSMNFNPATTPLNDASPRYWALWPGVLMMFAASFAEIAMNAPAIYGGIRAAVLTASDKIRRRPVRTFEGEIVDPAKPEDQTPLWAWTLGLFLSILFTCIVCCLQYHMNLGNVILAIVLAFIFAFIGVQSSGTTDINPVGTVAKASQLIIGGCLRGQGKIGNPGLLENLVAGSIASSAAGHAVDMVGDLKTGHLLRAKPRNQFWAQIIASFFAIFLSTGLFVLFAKAYPCIIDVNLADDCQFAAPSTAAWKAVAQAVLSPKLPVSLSSGLTAIGFAVLACVTVFAKYKLIPARYHVWVPNFNAIGLGFVVPQNYYPIAMCAGATTALIWRRRWPKSYEVLAIAIAAGMVAGEGIGGVMNAVLTIAKVDGDRKGSTVGLPPW